MGQIDEAIGRVEELYQTVTGKPMPRAEKPFAPIPAEKDPIQHITEQVMSLLARLGVPPQQEATVGTVTPALTLWESEGEVLICLDLPGVKRENVNIVLQENLLTLSARRTSPGQANGHRVRWSETAPAFYRMITLPTHLKPEAVDAQMKDGVLEIRIPRESNKFASTQTVPVK
jgi:HSP20 family protein